MSNGAGTIAAPLPSADTGLRRHRPWQTVLFIALKDLAHERLLTACLVLSLVAVLVPLLVLLSVKIGFVERVRSDFIDDPSFRQISPRSPDFKTLEQIESFGALPGAAFIVPSAMLVPRDVFLSVRANGRRRSEEVRLMPTATGDPLHERLQGVFDADNPDAAILTSNVATKYDITVGDQASIMLVRMQDGRARRETVDLTVTGILPEELLDLPSILAHSSLDQAVGSYLAGLAVPERGWAPVALTPKQAYDSVLIASPEPLSESDLKDMTLTVGAVRTEAVLTPETGKADLISLVGLPGAQVDNPLFQVRSGITHVYRMMNYAEGGAADSTRLYSARDVAEANRLAGRHAGLAFGFNPPVTVSIDDQEMTAIAPDPRLFTGMRGLYHPWRFVAETTYSDHASIYAPSGRETRFQKGQTLTPSFRIGTGEAVEPLVLPVSVAGHANVPDGVVLASPALVGMAMRIKQVPVTYDAASQSIVEQSTGFRGFRLVADTIDDVPALVSEFDEIGLAVRARSDAIIKLQRLDRGLGFLVLVVGAVSLVGGLWVMGASLIASVKRKANIYATFRLIGMSKRMIFCIPIMQSLAVAVAAYLLSILLYLLVSNFINGTIVRSIEFDGALSVLYPGHFAMMAVIVLVGAAVSSLLAAREATDVDPSLALRSR